MFCSNCGKDVSQEDNFCRNCGFSLKGEVAASKEEQWEICTIEESIRTTPGGFLSGGGVMVNNLIAYAIGPQGRRIVLESEEYNRARLIMQRKYEQIVDGLLEKIINDLVEDGWEILPGLANPNQRFSKQFRRKVQK